MAQAFKNPMVEPRVTLTPATIVLATAALLGLISVLIPAEMIQGSALLRFRRANDHAFAIAVLLVTAWASWRVSVEMESHHARMEYLKTVASAFDALPLAEQFCLLDCLGAANLTVRRGCHNAAALSLQNQGFLEQRPYEDHRHPHALVTFRMAPDVAYVLRTHLKLPPAAPRAAGARTEDEPDAKVGPRAAIPPARAT
jgi:hypothetical protein